MNYTNFTYADLLDDICKNGELVQTRNATTLRKTGLVAEFNCLPLVSTRNTAWKMALIEWGWMSSGKEKCPDKLLPWWDNQLNSDNEYLLGYGSQLRRFGDNNFDQIEWLIKELQAHPNSRRLITTTWNPEEMRRITEVNNNPNTPTTCHGTFSQYFVSNGKLHLLTVQRSADMLLGVPHNWVQYWAYLTWLAHRTGYKVGTMKWVFGDAHIYQEESHIQCAKEIIQNSFPNPQIDFIYSPTSKEFKASDFTISGTINKPKVLIRPKLL